MALARLLLSGESLGLLCPCLVGVRHEVQGVVEAAGIFSELNLELHVCNGLMQERLPSREPTSTESGTLLGDAPTNLRFGRLSAFLSKPETLISVR